MLSGIGYGYGYGYGRLTSALEGSSFAALRSRLKQNLRSSLYSPPTSQ